MKTRRTQEPTDPAPDMMMMMMIWGPGTWGEWSWEFKIERRLVAMLKAQASSVGSRSSLELQTHDQQYQP